MNKKPLLKNIFFLYLLQVANYLIPLITLPYLTRVLGVESFGLMGIAVSAVGLMSLLTDWGFSLTATQDVARNAENKDNLKRIFWHTVGARILLGLVAYGVLFLALFAIPSLKPLSLLFLAASLQLLPNMFGVAWFLQGLEKMGSFVWSSLLGRFLSLPLILLLVKNPDDLFWALLIPGLCGFVSCFVSFREAAEIISLFPIRISFQGMWEQIRKGSKIFASTGAINLYTQSNILILSALTTTTQVGLYNGAERIRRAVQSLVGPATTALFPRINNLLANDRQAAKKMMIKMLIGQGSFTLLLSLCMFFIAPWGVPFVLGKDFMEAIPVVQWLAPLPFLIGLSNVFGINVMLPLGMKNQFATIVTSSAAVNFISMILLCPPYGAQGAAMSSVIAETFVTTAMGLTLLIRLQKKTKGTA